MNESPRDPFLAFVADDVCRKVVAEAATQFGWNPGQVLVGGLQDAKRALTDVPTPNILLLDVSGSADPIEGVVSLAEVCDAGTRVITIGSVNDVELYRGLVDVGVDDYLLKPLGVGTLLAAFKRATAEPENIADVEESESLDGRLVVTIGARGGVGASSIAVNAAWMMAHEQGLRVALVDMDLYFGTVALAFDLEPGRGFREALENPARIDSLFLERALVRESENLAVLATEASLDQPLRFNSGAVDLLIEKLRSNFDVVLIELPRSLLPSCPSVLTEAEVIAVVSDFTLAGMRDTLRLSSLINDIKAKGQVAIVVNRAGFSPDLEMSQKDFEHGIKRPVNHVIPNDIKPLAKSVSEGTSAAAVAKSGKFVTALRDLVGQMSGGKVEEEQPSLLKRLFRK
ncbi:MAG: AAA family ATPase [Rhodospirillales bacterium]|nr:AAA family ATPase [Rhodospirillales bacterium]